MGIAGIDGNGQKELVEAITNLKPTEKGQIIINGVEIQNTSPNNVLKNKIATIHEDRQKVGLVLDFTVAENIILDSSILNFFWRKRPTTDSIKSLEKHEIYTTFIHSDFP